MVLQLRTFTLTFSLLTLFFTVPAATRPYHLTVEAKENPVGISNTAPFFGWWIESSERNFMQSAYQIQVAGTSEDLKGTKSLIWDSGKFSSSENSFVKYAGKKLGSARQYFWRVRVWNQNGKVSEWSNEARFSTSLLDDREWSAARWIAYEALDPSMRLVPGVHGNGDNLGEKAVKRAVVPYFRKSFELPKRKIREAYIFSSGLGHYEVYLNGKKVGNDFLAPGWTNYDKSVLYNTYNVTDQLTEGKNVIGALVGTGFFYINRERYRKLVIAQGYPMFRSKLLIRYTDGSTEEINTDGTWKTDRSPISFTSIYGGEDYDANLEQPEWNTTRFSDKTWKPVILPKAPDGIMKAQVDYPLAIMDTIKSVEAKALSQKSYLYDFGQNASGIIRVRVKGKKGDRVRIIPAEVLDDKGLPYQNASGGPFSFEYVLKGEGEEVWEPKFTYYGFRYAQVDGIDSAAIRLELLHTRNSSPSAGSFECSHPLFNKIYSLIDWACRSNMASVTTDCPHREKLGWLEQTHLVGGSLKYNYEVYHLYNKAIDDMIEAQLPNGLVPDIVPEYVTFEGGFRDSPEWGSASVIVPWYLYQWYGDKGALSRAYEMMKKYVAYLGTKAEDNILSFGLGDWFDLGPKDPGPSQLTPIPLTATAFYYYDADILSKVASILGKTDDARLYEKLAASIKASFNKKFYQPESGVYATGSQTSYAIPLYMGLVEENDRERVFKNLVDSVNANNKALTAGDIGFRYLVRALEEGNASQLLFEMNNRDDVPGYGFQIRNGATALTESWPALKYVSNNHMMLGHLMEWLYSGLGGIKQAAGDKGFRNVVIEPQMVNGIDSVKTRYRAISGEFSSEWIRKNGHTELKVSIPANTKATVILPFGQGESLLESGVDVKKNRAIKMRYSEGKVLVDVGSGTYTFRKL